MATVYGRQSGLPGIQQDNEMSPEMQAMLLMRPEAQTVIGKEDVGKAISTLQEYKSGKANLERRIVEEEQWWKLRHWEVVKGKNPEEITPQPSSAWLFNALMNKHADAMDNYPEPVVLPREESDRDSAKILSSVLPVVMEYNDFEQAYSDNWWYKLKHGASSYGVFWNTQKENGLGDIDIKPVDLLKLYWEPGITNIQKSRNLFIVDLVDEDLLNAQYPEYGGKLKGNGIDVKQYIYDDTVDTSDKAVVVDWYYKRQAPDGRTLVHYAKIVGNTLLYASENEPEYQQRGFYDHGQYPVVMDVLFPAEGTPTGFGYISICKDPQLYIDRLSANILENSLMNTKKRFFASTSTNINVKEFLDWNKPIVHVEGSLDDTRLKEIVCQPLNGIYLSVVQQKIEEMKDTAGNRDVNSGGTGSGVTSGAAITALQEAGNKVSRDMIAASYRTFTEICTLTIELMRQFYDEARAFRVMEPGSGDYQFINFDNAQIKDQQIGAGAMPLYRKPIFDLKIKAQKKNPFSRMEQNDIAQRLYGMGFFAPEKAQEAMIALDLMDFEGIEAVREKVIQGQTLMNICQQLMQENAQLKALITGIPPQMAAQGGGARANTGNVTGGNMPTGGLASGNATYAQKLAQRSRPDVGRTHTATTPGAGR